jgi:hypothetical protein
MMDEIRIRPATLADVETIGKMAYAMEGASCDTWC